MFSNSTHWPLRGLVIPIFLIFFAGAIGGSTLIGWVIWEAGIETGKALSHGELQ